MRGVYTVIFENVSVSAAQDLFELLAADDKPLAVVGLMISQISDVGDAAEEMLRLEIIRGFTGSGSGGSSATPAATDPSDGAASFTAEVNNTTLATTGTGTVLHADAFNIRSGFQMWWTPEAMLKCAQGGLLVVRLMAAPEDAVTLSGTLYVMEL